MSGLIPVLIMVPVIGAFICFILGKINKKLRNSCALIVCLSDALVLVLCSKMVAGNATGVFKLPSFSSLGISLSLDGFRYLYCAIAIFMWLLCTLFSREYFRNQSKRSRYYFFWLLTLGSTIGVFLADDLFTAFLFFELVSFCSYPLVAQDETKDALKAAGTYLAIAVIGGLTILMGLFFLMNTVGTLNIEELMSASEHYIKSASQTGADMTRFYCGGILILFGFGAKAGIVPLHIWLPKAHPVAPSPSSAVLSGMLTKVGIFGILVISCRVFSKDVKWGLFVLTLGLLTMALGAVLAVFSVDFKRTLACSSVSQIGFILTGIGMQSILGDENITAVRGTLLHMVNHSLFKLTLFLIAGVVVMNLHKLNLNDIRGFGRKKPFLKICFLCGALGIGGVPLFSGYISKTLLHESILEGKTLCTPGYLTFAEVVFLISGGLTIAYMLKLFIAVFVEKNSNQEDKMRASDSKYLSLPGKIAIGLPALLLVILGVFPNIITDRIADFSQHFMNEELDSVRTDYFTVENLKGAVISILIGCAVYFLFVRTFLMKKDRTGKTIYINRIPQWFDLEDSIYRPVLLKLFPAAFGFVCRILDQGLDGILLLLRKTVYRERPTERLVIGTKMTYRFGKVFNLAAAFLNKTIRKKKPINHDYVVTFAELRELNTRRNRMIESSLSFGLLMFCIGLCLILVYLMFL